MRTGRKRRRVKQRSARLTDKEFAFLVIAALVVLAVCGIWYDVSVPYDAPSSDEP